MQYSLFNRFCGVLLGAAAGEHWGGLVAKPTRSPFSSRAEQPIIPRYSLGMAAIAQSLVACQTLDLTDCQQRLSALSEPRSPIEKSPVEKLDVSELAILALPLALFFHEDDLKLRRSIQSLVQLLGSPPELSLGAWVVGFAITQALQEKLHPPTLLDRILDFLPSVAPETAIASRLGQQLQQVQGLVSQRAGLEAARMQLIRQATPQVDPKVSQQTTAIALAFYSWLSTPEESRLAVLRSQQFGYRPIVVGSLTGALAGAYNGRMSLPVSWCLAVEPPSAAADAEPNQSPQLSWVTLAADLLAIWSGAYEVTQSVAQRRQFPAIAAPRVIRPR